MEIDVFPLAHSKEGFARNFDKAFLGLLIITYIVLAYKTAVAIIGDDGKDGIVCFLLTIPIFIAYYSLFVLVLHCLKSALYAYFKAHRKELNIRADREEFEECMVQESARMKKDLQEKNTVADSSNATQTNSVKDANNDESIVQEEQTTPNVVTPEALKNIQVERELKESIEGLKTFMINNNLLREQMRAKKLAEEKKKLDDILNYTNLTLMQFGFSDDELYQIRECVKTFVEYKGVTSMQVLNISKKKGLKQADLKNFAWNIAFQYKIEAKYTALFVLNVFYAWFNNTEPSTIQSTLHNVKGKYAIVIDENIIEHLPQLEEKVLGKKQMQ